jgi:hypothetical protein
VILGFGANGLIDRNLADLKACQFTFSRAVTPAVRSAIDAHAKHENTWRGDGNRPARRRPVAAIPSRSASGRMPREDYLLTYRSITLSVFGDFL